MSQLKELRILLPAKIYTELSSLAAKTDRSIQELSCDMLVGIVEALGDREIFREVVESALKLEQQQFGEKLD